MKPYLDNKYVSLKMVPAEPAFAPTVLQGDVLWFQG